MMRPLYKQTLEYDSEPIIIQMILPLPETSDEELYFHCRLELLKPVGNMSWSLVSWDEKIDIVDVILKNSNELSYEKVGDILRESVGYQCRYTSMKLECIDVLDELECDNYHKLDKDILILNKSMEQKISV